MNDKERLIVVCNELKRISRLYNVKLMGYDDGSIIVDMGNNIGWYEYRDNKHTYEFNDGVVIEI